MVSPIFVAISKLPSKSLTTPMEESLIEMDTPGSGELASSSITVPLSVISCATNITGNNTRI